MDLKNKNVFVTGSSRGIGLAIATAFAKEGANIVLNGRKEISKDLIAQIKAYGVDCIGVTGDISDFESCGQMLQETEEKLGPVHVLVNNAGINKDKLLLRMTQADFEEVVKINLTGTFNMTQQVLKKMMKLKMGCILNLSSVSGVIGNVGQANYAASKAGIIGFTKTVAKEAALRHITCNAIAPGFIQTDMTNALADKVKEQVTQSIPLKEFGQVEDVAKTAVFLAKSPYITGQVIHVDGGLVM